MRSPASRGKFLLGSFNCSASLTWSRVPHSSSQPPDGVSVGLGFFTMKHRSTSLQRTCLSIYAKGTTCLNPQLARGCADLGHAALGVNSTPSEPWVPGSGGGGVQPSEAPNVAASFYFGLVQENPNFDLKTVHCSFCDAHAKLGQSIFGWWGAETINTESAHAPRHCSRSHHVD